MFNVDVSDLRKERQKYNNSLVADKLYNDSPSYSELDKIANIKAVDRLLDELEMEYDDLLTECANNHLYSKTVAIAIAKNSTRQGKKDESFVIDGIANAMKEYGYEIRCCGVNEYRPCKDGQMLTNEEFKKQQLNKDVDALKSVDGIFSGPKSGYIFAKVVIGDGGHQDNVLHEMNQYIQWATTHGDKNKIYVMLVDGKEFDVLKSKQTDNIWVVNHIEFQERLLGQ
jgi:hypothetical protein